MKTKIISALLCFMLVALPCLASNESMTVEKNSVSLSGVSEIPLQSVVIQVITPGKAVAENSSDIIYQNQTETDEKGNYSFSFTLSESLKSGDYTANLIFESGEKKSFILSFKNDLDIKNAEAALENAQNSETARPLLEQYGESLELDMSLYNALNDEGKNRAAELYIKISANQGISKTDAFKNASVAAATTYYPGDFSELVTGKFKDFTGFAETDAYKQFSAQINLSEIGNRLKTVYIDNIDTAKDRFSLETGLWIIKQANGWYDVQQAVNLIAPVLQLDISEFSKAPEKIGPSLAGKSYNETTFSAAFNEAVKGYVSGLNVVFWDVAQHTPWANESVTELYKAGIVNGISTAEFNPNGNVTREQFAKMLVSMLGDMEYVSTTSFSDVPQEQWYAPFVATAKEIGLVNGISSTEFGVGRNITREQMAAMIYRAGKLLGYIPAGNAKIFTDAAAISGYAKESIDALTAGGVINGKADGSFAPQSTATRAEAACMIYNMICATSHSTDTKTGLKVLSGNNPLVGYAENFDRLSEKEYKERDLASLAGWYFVPSEKSTVAITPAPKGRKDSIPSGEGKDMSACIMANESAVSGFFDTEPFFLAEDTYGNMRLEMNLYLSSDNSSENYKVFDMMLMSYVSATLNKELPFVYFAGNGGVYYYNNQGMGIRCGSYTSDKWISFATDIDTVNETFDMYVDGVKTAENIPLSNQDIYWDGSEPNAELKKIRLRMGVKPDSTGTSRAYMDDFLWAMKTDAPSVIIDTANSNSNQIALSVPLNIDADTLEHIKVSVNGTLVQTTGVLSGNTYTLTLNSPLNAGDKAEITVGKWVATTNGLLTGTPKTLTFTAQ